jgi:alpha-D-ribose 1-methylphosphonate 5-triphosphate synthase subunit PhnH
MLAPAFADPVRGSQAVFRSVMDAMARPGTIVATGGLAQAPQPLGPAAAAVALTLIDYETPAWLDPALAQSPEVAAWLRFHTGAPLTDDPRQAAFGFIGDPPRMPPFQVFSQGSMEYPDRAATLVLQVERLSDDGGFCLSGPGVKGTRALSASPLPADFAARMCANRALFPRGLDIILVSATMVAALPRSVHVATEQP